MLLITTAATNEKNLNILNEAETKKDCEYFIILLLIIQQNTVEKNPTSFLEKILVLVLQKLE